CTADDVCAAHHFGLKLAPDHPAAKGIIERHAIERDKRTAGARWSDGTQREPLGRGIGRERACAPEERDAWHLAQRLIDPRLCGKCVLGKRDDGKGALAARLRQMRRNNDNLLRSCLSRKIDRHGTPLKSAVDYSPSRSHLDSGHREAHILPYIKEVSMLERV